MSLKNETTELSKKIKDAVTVDVTAGEITETTPGSIYEQTLPEGIDKKLVKAVNNHNATFVAASTLAVGELSVDAMKKEPALERVTGSIKMANDTVSLTVDRSKTYKDHFGENDEVVKYGVTRTNYEVRAGKNGGQLKAARVAINELAADLLK